LLELPVAIAIERQKKLVWQAIQEWVRTCKNGTIDKDGDRSGT
jgi:hypothetical protein